jgi:hypothetical protein
MYLYRTGRVEGWNDRDYEEAYNKDLNPAQVDQLPEPMRKYAKPYEFLPNCLQVFEKFAYWRKFNALHGWFVDNVQDGKDECQLSREINRDDFESLLADLEEDSLEPTSGFFFGSTCKDEWYRKDVEETIAVVKKILDEVDFKTERLMYRSSW